MKKILKFLTGRMVLVTMLILVQLCFLIWMVLRLSLASWFISLLLETLGAVTVIWLVSKNENPSYKLAWVIVILALPIVGVVFYLIFGRKKMPRKESRHIMEYYQSVAPHLAVRPDAREALRSRDPMLGRQADYIARIAAAPAYQDTACAYFPLGEDFFERLMTELATAQQFIFMEYFILEPGKMWDTVFALLQAKARAGVDVRVMFDDLGSIQTLPAGYERTIAAAGIKAAVFNPFRPHVNAILNYRDHRKICIIDGNTGFTGGINLADEYINAYEKHGHWKDTAVMLKGAAVENLTMMFLQLWGFTVGERPDFDRYHPTESYPGDGFVQPFGDSPLDDQNVSEEAYMQIIGGATRYVYITTPYLILDNEMVVALSLAAKSGVDVRIITPHVPDKWFVHPVTRSFYLPLIRAGVKIYEYTPGFIHAKMFVADDKVAIVGTANMDYRSFYLHFECGAAFYFSSVVGAVKEDILKTLGRCQLISEKEAAATFPVRIARAMLRVFAPLM